MTIRLGVLLAFSLPGWAWIPQAKGQEPVLVARVQLNQGLVAPEPQRAMLLRGAPLEVVVTLANATAEDQFLRYLEDVRIARADAAARGDVLPRASFEVPPEMMCRLPVANGGWADWLTVEVLRLDEGAGVDAVTIVSASRFRECLAEQLAGSAVIGRVGGGPIVAVVTFAPEETAGAVDGMYVARITYDTTLCEAEDAWRGRVVGQSTPLQLRAATTPEEMASVAYTQARYYLARSDYVKAGECAQRIVSQDDAFRYYEGYILLGDALNGQGDPVAAVKAWENFLDKSPKRTEGSVIRAVEGRVAAAKADAASSAAKK